MGFTALTQGASTRLTLYDIVERTASIGDYRVQYVHTKLDANAVGVDQGSAIDGRLVLLGSS